MAVVSSNPVKRSQVPRAGQHVRPTPSAAKDIEHLARWLDTLFVVPGTNYRVGFDALLGLIPGVGDGASALLGLYIVARAQALGAPNSLIARMLANIVVDTALGAVPLIGDVFDVAFKANLKNVRMLMEHLQRQD